MGASGRRRGGARSRAGANGSHSRQLQPAQPTGGPENGSQGFQWSEVQADDPGEAWLANVASLLQTLPAAAADIAAGLPNGMQQTWKLGIVGAQLEMHAEDL